MVFRDLWAGDKNTQTNRRLSKKVECMGGERAGTYLEEVKERSGTLAVFYTLFWVALTQMLALWSAAPLCFMRASGGTPFGMCESCESCYRSDCGSRTTRQLPRLASTTEENYVLKGDALLRFLFETYNPSNADSLSACLRGGGVERTACVSDSLTESSRCCAATWATSASQRERASLSIIVCWDVCDPAVQKVWVY